MLQMPDLHAYIDGRVPAMGQRGLRADAVGGISFVGLGRCGILAQDW
jgi:hypothetical protein